MLPWYAVEKNPRQNDIASETTRETRELLSKTE